MNLRAVDELGAANERAYLEFVLWHYRVIDAFWFLKAEETYGLAEAEALNERVWAKSAQLAARRIREQFGVTEKGLSGFLKAYRLFPWSLLVDYDIRQGADEILVEVASCPPQEARKKRGLGEYACKCMHHAEFAAFAREIDPAIRVECLFAPPDPHPETPYCRWRFSLRPPEGGAAGAAGAEEERP